MQAPDFVQVIFRSIFFLLVASLIAIQARPPHFGENNQVLPEQDANSVPFENGLKLLQMEALLAQRLAEPNQINQLPIIDYGYERSLRSGNDIKRQSRYRLCYFNPVSCFKK